MLRTISFALVVVLSLVSRSAAVPILSVGSPQPTATPNSFSVSVFVSTAVGDPAHDVAGLNFYFGTGPFAGTPGDPTGNGPKITAVDLLTGTIFAANTLGQTNPTPPGPTVRKIKATTVTSSGTVNANGLL